MPHPEASYTHGHHDAVLRSHSWRTAENSAAYLVPYLGRELSILDVGCGPGSITADLAQMVAPGRVVGIDPSDDVIARAQAGSAQRDGGMLPANLRFEVADLYDLRLGDEGVPGGGFDVVHAHQVLQHLPDPAGALRAMARLAGSEAPGPHRRPYGLVAARDANYAAMYWSPANELLDRWQEVIREVTSRNGGEPDAGRFLLQWAHAAGLDDVTYTSSTWTFTAPDDLAWWGDLWADRISISGLATQAQDYGIATADELTAIAQAWRRWATHPDAMFVVTHGEIVARVARPD